MSFKSKFALVALSASLAVYAIAGGWLATRAQQPANDPNAQFRIFDSVLQHIQNDYVDEPNMEKVRAGALRGLAYGLDPYSTYLTAEEVKDTVARKRAAASASAPNYHRSLLIFMSLHRRKARPLTRQACARVTSLSTSMAKPRVIFLCMTRASCLAAHRERKSNCVSSAPTHGR